MRTRSSRHAVVKDPQQNAPATVAAPSATHNVIDLVSTTAVSSSSSPLTALPRNQSESGSGKAISRPPKPAQKRRKIKKIVDAIDSRPYIPRIRVRGQARGQDKVDSTIFDKIVEIIWRELSEEKRSSFACLDSMSFYLYSQNNFIKEKVLTWIKRMNIFSKHYVFVPIVLWSHWSLLILCHLGEKHESKARTPCMLLLDSMQQIGTERLEQKIRKFVFAIHKSSDLPITEESIHEIPLLVPKVPQQRNGDECGRYVLYFINLFLENAPESFDISKGYPYFMKEDWFNIEGLDNFWQRCNTLIMECNEKDEAKSEDIGIDDGDIIDLT